MQLCHTPAALSAAFDEPNLIASAGLVPGVALADRIGLRGLADEWLTVPGSAGCSGAKVMSLVVGMLAGADSIDDMDLLRHGGMGQVFTDVRAPSTLGSFLRNFTFGHVRQLDAVASRALIGLAEVVPGLLAGGDGLVMLDIDDTVKPVFGATKQGAQHGYTKVKGLNAQVATQARCSPANQACRPGDITTGQDFPQGVPPPRRPILVPIWQGASLRRQSGYPQRRRSVPLAPTATQLLVAWWSQSSPQARRSRTVSRFGWFGLPHVQDSDTRAGDRRRDGIGWAQVVAPLPLPPPRTGPMSVGLARAMPGWAALRLVEGAGLLMRSGRGRRPLPAGDVGAHD